MYINLVKKILSTFLPFCRLEVTYPPWRPLRMQVFIYVFPYAACLFKEFIIRHCYWGFHEKGIHSYLCPQGQIDSLHRMSVHSKYLLYELSCICIASKLIQVLQVPTSKFQVYLTVLLTKAAFSNLCYCPRIY